MKTVVGDTLGTFLPFWAFADAVVRVHLITLSKVPMCVVSTSETLLTPFSSVFKCQPEATVDPWLEINN